MEERAIHIFAIAAYGLSPYLEEQIRSLQAQTDPSEIILCTATDHGELRDLAEKYGLPFLLREGEPGLQADWNFAYEEGRKRAHLVTIVHQDDRYRPDYGAELKKSYARFPDLSVFCCPYETIDEQGRRRFGLSESVKKLLRFRLRNQEKGNRTAVKLSALRWGNGIGCPTCTYNSDLCGTPLFQNNYRFVIDWDTLIRIAYLPGRFVLAEKVLMEYRVHSGSETMHQMESHNREREEEMEFRKLHHPLAAKLLMFFYRLSYTAYQKKG